MQVVLNDIESSSRVVIEPERPLTDQEFYDFCQANPGLRIERTAQGEIIVMSPTGGRPPIATPS